MELRQLIEGLDDAASESLLATLGAPFVPNTRFGLTDQLWRAWFRRPVDEGRFDDAARHALRLVLGARRGIAPAELPGHARALVQSGWLFAGEQGRLYMPDALRLCLATTPSDPPHAARLLLPRLEATDMRPLSAAHYGRPLQGPPHALLERPLRHLLDEDWVRNEREALETDARTLLDAAVAHAGQLSADQILDIEREPTRMRVGGASVVPRRSKAFVLARLGLLLPVSGLGWVVPDEVYEALTARERARRAARLAKLAARDDDDEPLPSRVERALHAGASSAALLAVLHARGALREGVGVARGALERAARDVGVSLWAAPVLASVGRAAGLPFGGSRLGELGFLLWRTWRTTGAWNELAEQPDAFRPAAAREPLDAVLRAVRETVLETLEGLPPHRFATRDEVLAAVTASARVGKERAELVERILDHSLPALGYVDVGENEGQRVLRATADARAFLAAQPPVLAAPPAPSARADRVDAPVRVPAQASLGSVRCLARVGRLWVDGAQVACELDAVELGLEAAERGWAALAGDLAPVWPMDSAAVCAQLQALAVESVTLPWHGLTAAVHVPDAALRARLLADREGADVWLRADKSGDYLLVREGASFLRVQRLLRKHGLLLRGA